MRTTVCGSQGGSQGGGRGWEKSGWVGRSRLTPRQGSPRGDAGCAAWNLLRQQPQGVQPRRWPDAGGMELREVSTQQPLARSCVEEALHKTARWGVPRALREWDVLGGGRKRAGAKWWERNGWWERKPGGQGWWRGPRDGIGQRRAGGLWAEALWGHCVRLAPCLGSGCGCILRRCAKNQIKLTCRDEPGAWMGRANTRR